MQRTDKLYISGCDTCQRGKAFEAHLGELDLQERSQREIVRLRQSGSCAVYAARFSSLSINTGMNDTALMFLFKTGLKPELRKALMCHRYTENGLTFAPTLRQP